MATTIVFLHYTKYNYEILTARGPVTQVDLKNFANLKTLNIGSAQK